MSKKVEGHIPYEKIVNYLPIEKGDILYIPSQILRLARYSKKQGENFDANSLLDSFQNAVGTDGTILIPTFNWEFSNEGTYDIKQSPCTTGSLGRIALEKEGYRRTKHPLHSFAVWGKNRDIICEEDNHNSYAEDSPFAFMKKNNAKCVIFGTDYCHAYTFIHYVEFCEQVWYRYMKNFQGIYTMENGKKINKEYSLYVRYLDVKLEENFNLIGNVMEEEGVAEKFIINNEPYIIIDIAKSYSVIAEDIRHNQCKNLYIFE